MFTKIVVTATAAAFLLGTASPTLAAPKNRQVPEAAQNNQRMLEPLYFQHATGHLRFGTGEN